jgi:hypothetical protein
MHFLVISWLWYRREGSCSWIYMLSFRPPMTCLCHISVSHRGAILTFPQPRKFCTVHSLFLWQRGYCCVWISDDRLTVDYVVPKAEDIWLDIDINRLALSLFIIRFCKYILAYPKVPPLPTCLFYCLIDLCWSIIFFAPTLMMKSFFFNATVFTFSIWTVVCVHFHLMIFFLLDSGCL